MLTLRRSSFYVLFFIIGLAFWYSHSLSWFWFSLANVSKDVEEHSDQIEKLEIGVAGTKVVLKKVHRDVKKQGKDLEGVKEGLDDVNTRVDNVEVDVEETKERVKEVDKKVVKTVKLFN